MRHILVDKEADAKDIIAALQKGEKFEKLAERSKDTGSKANGGDLDWNAPANFVKPFSDAMVALPKGKFTTTPVQIAVRLARHSGSTTFAMPRFRPMTKSSRNWRSGCKARSSSKYLKDLRAKNGL